jgi:sulfite exporter TauE/SafE
MEWMITALALGFLGSFHCVGMCGPLAMALPLPGQELRHKVLGALLYNMGRVVTYALLGVLFGALGASLFLTGYQQQLSIAAGAFMILAVALPALLHFKAGSQRWYQKLFQPVQQAIYRQFNRMSWSGVLTVGLLNGLLPCGLVYMGITGSIVTGSVVKGSLFMALFGLGTLPAMLLLMLSKSMWSMPVRNRIKKTLPYMVALVGVLLVLRGLNLGIPYVSPAFHDVPAGQLNCHP